MIITQDLVISNRSTEKLHKSALALQIINIKININFSIMLEFLKQEVCKPNQWQPAVNVHKAVYISFYTHALPLHDPPLFPSVYLQVRSRVSSWPAGGAVSDPPRAVWPLLYKQAPEGHSAENKTRRVSRPEADPRTPVCNTPTYKRQRSPEGSWGSLTTVETKVEKM